MIAPVTPALADATGAGPATIGALVAMFPLGMFGGFVVAGRSVQKGRTTAVLASSLVLVAIGSLGFVLGDRLAVYFPSRALMGFGSGGLWMGVTFGTLERWPGEEYVCMSRIFAAYSAGGLIGPALGAIGGVRGPFAVYFVLVAIGLAFVALLGTPRERRAFRSDRGALRSPGFWLASAGILFVVLGLGMVEGVLPLHLSSVLSQAQIAGLYTGTALVVSAAAALAGTLRPALALFAATMLIVAGLAVAGLADTVPLWIPALVIVGIGIGAGNTGSMGILLESVGVERIVTAMVVWSQVSIVGYFIGPTVGGGVAEALGFDWVGLIPAAAAILLALAYLSARKAAGDDVQAGAVATRGRAP